jgi:hypothetical protein
MDVSQAIAEMRSRANASEIDERVRTRGIEK